ncbi:MAG: pyruvate kinase [Desulfobacteraceae bacterium 4572_35.1]|nr:MAG: pyruvate kinase [Desulfobacteraceae bacterium 4572_35.1]
MRRTKIVCTVGPVSASEPILNQMLSAGMDVARLNFSHGDHASHGKLIKVIRELAQRAGKPVAILQDLCGPKIRLGILPEEGIRLVPGEVVTLCALAQVPPEAIPVDCPILHEDVRVGDAIMLADGLMELCVDAIEDGLVKCRVITGGIAYSRKGVNLPASNLSIPAFTEKDRADLLFGLEQGVDIVALSFVRSAADLMQIRTMLDGAVSRPKLIAKIEKPQAIDNIDEILDLVDGIMIARGDLGVEMPLERVPVLQKQLIKQARLRGRSVITATQMLSSMVASPRPTRAEATDVANAIYDGTDALMLSDETASGKYPVVATEVLNRIAIATEPHVGNEQEMSQELYSSTPSISWAVGRAAGWLANDLDAGAILAYTQSGFTAGCVARFRPGCPIVAMTPDEQSCRQMNLLWGVVPVLIDACSSIDEMFALARQEVQRRKLVAAGERIIVTAGAPLWQPGSTNLLKVIQL